MARTSVSNLQIGKSQMANGEFLPSTVYCLLFA